jgi:hypothetical protein
LIEFLLFSPVSEIRTFGLFALNALAIPVYIMTELAYVNHNLPLEFIIATIDHFNDNRFPIISDGIEKMVGIYFAIAIILFG